MDNAQLQSRGLWEGSGRGELAALVCYYCEGKACETPRRWECLGVSQRISENTFKKIRYIYDAGKGKHKNKKTQHNPAGMSGVFQVWKMSRITNFLPLKQLFGTEL